LAVQVGEMKLLQLLQHSWQSQPGSYPAE